MMAPDPPREDRHQEHRDVDELDDDDETLQPGSFVVDWSAMDDEEDEIIFVPEGPHEIDMGSESEYSTDEDGDELSPPAESSENPGGGARGHYQMLIPFPAPQRSEDDTQIHTDEEDAGQDGPAEPEPLSHPEISSRTPETLPQEDSLPMSCVNASIIPSDNSTDMEGAEPTVTAARREITLTEEKVETIKSVMQNFTLPAPAWAAGFDEDVFKKRLEEWVDTKISPKDS